MFLEAFRLVLLLLLWSVLGWVTFLWEQRFTLGFGKMSLIVLALLSTSTSMTVIHPLIPPQNLFLRNLTWFAVSVKEEHRTSAVPRINFVTSISVGEVLGSSDNRAVLAISWRWAPYNRASLSVLWHLCISLIMWRGKNCKGNCCPALESLRLPVKLILVAVIVQFKPTQSQPFY